jgi:hypothetical protein
MASDEGLFVIDDQDIPESALAPIATRKDLQQLRGSWACMTNAFIARGGSNVKLKVFKPVGADDCKDHETSETPIGIVEQGRVMRTGEIEPLAGEGSGAIALTPHSDGPIRYAIVPESDLNGASLVYFARYEAMMNYGERVFLSDHRKAYFFGNATPNDVVEIRVQARVLPPGSFTEAPAGGAYRTPLKFLFRIDLCRGSDKVLMASSLVRKSLNVPGSAKGVLAEVERFLRSAKQERVEVALLAGEREIDVADRLDEAGDRLFRGCCVQHRVIARCARRPHLRRHQRSAAGVPGLAGVAGAGRRAQGVGAGGSHAGPRSETTPYCVYTCTP